MEYASKPTRGFTLVELIVVILLLSILSVYAASRYIGSSSFSVYAAREQAISIIRQVQLGRMQSNVDSDSDLSTEYQLFVTSDCLGSVASCDNPQDSRSSILVLPDDLEFSLTNTIIEFDLLGAPVNGATQIEISNNISIETVSVCINSEGYVSELEGACE